MMCKSNKTLFSSSFLKRLTASITTFEQHCEVVFQFNFSLVAIATIVYRSYGKYPVTQNTQYGC